VIKTIEEWLAPLDVRTKLECDGLSRVISMLLQKEKIPHRVFIGTFDLFTNNGKCAYSIRHHQWIELSDGYVCDFRIRMWIDEVKAPHGIFIPSKYNVYSKELEISIPVHEVLFYALAGCNMNDYPPLRR
jgi:hypothetical protein